MPFGEYLQIIRGTMEIPRYQNKIRHCKRSVAEHQWSVAIIAQGLANWEMKKFGNKVDMGELLQRAINHDVIESVTGDIISTTKAVSKEFRQALEVVEKIKYKSELEEVIPKSWNEDYKRFILHAKDDTIEGKIIKAADLIDALHESVEEVKLGNTEKFEPILVEVAEALLSIEIDSVKFYLKYAIKDFGLDIRRYFGINVYRLIEKIEFSKDILND